MVEQIFLSPQVKRSVIISYKLGLQVVSRVAEPFKSYDFRKIGNIRKLSKLNRIVA